MIFYKKILFDIQSGEKTFEHIYKHVFSFKNEIFFEEANGGVIISTTYQACKKEVLRTASVLSANFAGQKSGAPVGICLQNSKEWVICFWATLMAGHKPLLLNPNAESIQNERIMREAGAQAVIASHPIAGFRYFNITEIMSAKEEEGFTPDFENEILLSTSGVTGEPKICGYSGDAICAQILNTLHIIKKNSAIKDFYKGRLKVMCFLPFFHIFGLVANLLWFSIFGRTMVLLKNMSPETIRNTCRLHEVTHIFAMPLLWNTVADGIVREAEKRGQLKKLETGIKISLALQNLFPVFGRWFAARVLFRDVQDMVFGCGVKFCISGGGMIRKETLRIINGIGYLLSNGYGMTETGIASVELRHAVRHRLSGAVGDPLPSAGFSVADDGILHIRGESGFTASYSRGNRIPHDNMQWYPTGDIFYMENGCCFFKSRSDDLINGENGERISPDEIEQAFHSAYAKNICVLGMTDTGGRSEPVLVAELVSPCRGGQKMLLYEELERMNRLLPAYMRVKKILMTENAFPLSMNAKTNRALLRTKIMDGTLSIEQANGCSLPERTKVYEESFRHVVNDIRGCFAASTGADPLSVFENTHFIHDIAGSSLQYFELLERIERITGIKMIFAEKEACFTPEEFAAYIFGKTAT